MCIVYCTVNSNILEACRTVKYDNCTLDSVLIAGGDEIQNEIKRKMETRHNEPLAPGDVVITPAGGKLPSLYVLHGTVGTKNTAEDNILQLLYKNIFVQACELKIHTIALPLCGTG